MPRSLTGKYIVLLPVNVPFSVSSSWLGDSVGLIVDVSDVVDVPIPLLALDKGGVQDFFSLSLLGNR
jgi:hypothetical protein